MKLWLVRHAAPVLAAGTCYGRSDVTADAQGTSEAAAGLAAVLPPSLQVMASPARRCTQLARALAALRPDLHWSEDPRLLELDFGGWELQTWAAIPRQALDAWTADFARHRPGDGESVQELLARVQAAFHDAVRDGRDRLWITHAGVIRATALLVQGIFEVTDARQWPAETLPFGSWHVHEVMPLNAAGAPSRG